MGGTVPGVWAASQPSMSGGGQHQGGGGSQASAAGGNNAALQLDATIRALEHSHLTSRTLSLADFVLTGPPATLGSDVKLLYAKCSRAGLPQADKVYLLKVCGCIAALLALRAAAERAAGLAASGSVLLHVSVQSHCPATTRRSSQQRRAMHTKMSWRWL